MPAGAQARLSALAEELGLALTEVGCITAGGGLRVLRPDGTAFVPERSGYQHFAADPAGERP